jgi:hypothetical protein
MTTRLVVNSATHPATPQQRPGLARLLLRAIRRASMVQLGIPDDGDALVPR